MIRPNKGQFNWSKPRDIVSSSEPDARFVFVGEALAAGAGRNGSAALSPRRSHGTS